MVIIVERMFTSLILLLSFVFVFPSDAQTPTQLIPLYKETVPDAALKQYPLLPYKFIDLIKAIPKPLPASLDSFQKIFNNQLHITERDEDYIRYTTGSFRTLDGVIIKKVGVGVRVKAKDKVRGFGIYLDPKQCVNSRLLKKEFGFLIPELLSIHPLPNAPIAYYTPDEWGKFDMGSTMDYPDCATGVGVSVFSDKQKKKEWIKYVREQAPHLLERERQRALGGK